MNALRRIAVIRIRQEGTKVLLDLACGHTITKKPSEVGARPQFSRCRECAQPKEEQQ